jgi:hypothetical protein
VSIDQREYNGTLQPIWDILLNLESALAGGQSLGMFLRNTLASGALQWRRSPFVSPLVLALRDEPPGVKRGASRHCAAHQLRCSGSGRRVPVNQCGRIAIFVCWLFQMRGFAPA